MPMTCRPIQWAMLIAIGVSSPALERPAAAQPQGGATVLLYGDSITWRGEAGQDVTIALRRDGGTVARGSGRTSHSGAAAIGLEGVAGNEPVAITPGDVLAWAIGEALTETLAIPPLSAEAAEAGSRVLLSAPPGASVTLKRIIDGAWFRTERIGEVTADELGRAEVRLAQAKTDLQGLAEMAVDGRHTIRCAFARPRVYVDVSSGRLNGQATHGTRVALDLRTGLGQETHLSARVPQTKGSLAWQAALEGSFVLGAGTRITATHRAQDGSAATTSSEVPKISIEVDRRTGALSGEGPPSTRLHLALRDSEGVAISRTLQTNPDGTFRIASSEIEPTLGLAADITYDTGGVFVYRASAIIDSTTIGLYSADVSGFIGLASASVHIEVRSPDGEVKAAGSVRTDAHGRYRFSMSVSSDPRVHEDVLIHPGDVVIIDRAQGDPRHIVVPEISVGVDVDRGRLSGRAPPASIVGAGLGESDTIAVTHHTAADAAGRFELFLDDLALRRPASGIVEVQTADRVRFTLGWAAPSVIVELHTGEVRGAGPRGRPMSAKVVDPAGRTVGGNDFSLRAKNLEPVGLWITVLRDWAGEIVRPEPGDRLALDVSSEVLDIEIPWLHAEVDVASNRVQGQLNPMGSASLTLHRVDGQGHPIRHITAAVQGDAQGRFEHDFSDTDDIHFGDWIQLEFDDPAGHRILRASSVPAVVIDLDRSAVHGHGEPGSRIVVERGEDVWDGLVSASGSYFVELRGGDLTDVLHEGDHVTVRNEALEGKGSTKVLASMAIPSFTFDVDLDAGVAHGQAPAFREVEIDVASVFQRSGLGGTPSFGYRRVAVQSSGRFHAALDELGYRGLPILTLPGQRFRATATMEDGVRLVRWNVLPIANVQQRGALVCGYGQPGTDVRARVLAGPSEGASGTARVAANLAYALELEHPSGEPVSLGSGSQLELTFADDPQQLTLPRFDLTTDWSFRSPQRAVPTTLLSGWVGIGTQLFLRMPATGCLRGDSGAYTLEFSRSESFALDSAPRVDRGQGLLLGHYFGSRSHRQFHLQVRPKLRVFLGTDRIEGAVSPGTGTTIRLLDARGRQVATATTTGDTHGRLRSRLTATSGDEPIEMAPGMTLTAQFGSTREALVLGDVSFDFSTSAGVVVLAQPDSPMRLELDSLDGRTHTTSGTTGPDGRWHVRAHDLPARSGWDFADVARIRAVVVDASGHEFVSESVLRQPRSENVLFLPVGVRR